MFLTTTTIGAAAAAAAGAAAAAAVSLYSSLPAPFKGLGPFGMFG